MRRREKSIAVAVLFQGFLACTLLGQLKARIDIDQAQFILFEPVTADLIIQNLSGRNLELDPDQFYFLVKFNQNRPVSRLEAPIIRNPIRLPAGATITNRLNFSGSFQIREHGPYTLGGRIDFYGRIINMPYTYTDVVPGILVGELHTVANTGGGAAHRNLKLISNYRDHKLHLFLWIEDPLRGLSYGVYDLGDLLSIGKPRIEVGEDNRIHILHRSKPSQYIHSVFTMNGTPVSRDVLVSAGGQPKLNRNPDGSLSVAGAGQEDERGDVRIRAFTLDDEE